MPTVPEKFSGVSVQTKANIYFEGKVVSHTLLLPDGSKKTLGVIQAGEYHFGTQAGERMEIVAGVCSVVLDGQSEAREYRAGEMFEVRANAGFTIRVREGQCEYICSFLE